MIHFPSPAVPFLRPSRLQGSSGCRVGKCRSRTFERKREPRHLDKLGGFCSCPQAFYQGRHHAPGNRTDPTAPGRRHREHRPPPDAMTAPSFERQPHNPSRQTAANPAKTLTRTGCTSSFLSVQIEPLDQDPPYADSRVSGILDDERLPVET